VEEQNIFWRLKRVIIELNDNSLHVIDYINANHHSYYEDLSHVTTCGDNIMFRPLAEVLKIGVPLNKKAQLKPFINQVKPTILKFEDKPHIKNFQYDTSFLFSCLSSTRDKIA